MYTSAYALFEDSMAVSGAPPAYTVYEPQDDATSAGRASGSHSAAAPPDYSKPVGAWPGARQGSGPCVSMPAV